MIGERWSVIGERCLLQAVSAGQSFGSIESVKAVSELFAPVTGEVAEVNTHLKDHPEVVNQNPHGTWMIKVRMDGAEGHGQLLDSADYSKLVAE